MVDVFPSVTIQPRRDFAVTAGVDFLWRYSTRDGFYQPPGVLLVPSSANTDRFLGEQYNLHAEWQATAHINVNAVYVHFTPAGFLKSAGAKGIDYVGIWTAYIF
jgi:alginate export protein